MSQIPGSQKDKGVVNEVVRTWNGLSEQAKVILVKWIVRKHEGLVRELLSRNGG